MELAQAYCYCPACGARRDSFEPVRPFRCHACGHTNFFGPVAAVGAVVTNQDGHCLLIRRARDPASGRLGMPGGFVDPGESAERALEREVLEEVGLRIIGHRYLMSAPNNYLYRGIDISVVDMFFHVSVDTTATIAIDDGEVAGWIWTPITDEVLSQMAFPSNRRALEFYRGNVREDA